MKIKHCFGIKAFQGLIASAILVSSLTTISRPTLAEVVSYTVGPLLTISNVKNSQSRATLDVTNSGKEPLRLRIYVEDFTYDREKGFTPTSSHPYSAVQYLQFSPRELVIPPKSTRNVRVNILIPPSVPDGEYRAIVFAEELKDDRANQLPSGGATVFKTRIGSVFYVVKGNGKADISAISAEWNAEKKRPQIVLENKGLATSNPEVQWKIERDGKEIESGVIQGILVQNRSQRLASLNSKKVDKLPSGEYIVSGQLRFSDGTSKPFSFKLKIPN
jgi:P pilus assembly chaperone PapD